MPIRLRKVIQNYQDKYKIKLLAGEVNLDNVMNWTHVLESISTIGFLRGNELVITTGIGMDTDVVSWLNTIVTKLVAQNSCGLIVNTGEYITHVPPETIAFCEEKNFPLFSMPWEVRLVDIIQDCCTMIFEDSQYELAVVDAFKSSIFFPQNTHSYLEILKDKGYFEHDHYCSASVRILQGDSEDFYKLSKIHEIVLRNWINRFCDSYILFTHNQHFILIFHNQSKDIVEKALNSFSNQNKVSSGNPMDVTVGIGPQISSVTDLYKSFKRGESTFQLALKKSEKILQFDALGISKLLMSIEEKDVLVDYYQDTLGELLLYDQENNTDYIEILRLYLLHNSSIQAVSEVTFTHRNTINYRIKKIKNILNSDLSDVKERFALQLAFYIEDFL